MDIERMAEPALKGQIKENQTGYRAFNLKSAELIKSQIGDIEEVRKRLGLSKRKICQLLLIDPSTWTRWTTGKTSPPPYIYRMLQWGLALMEKYPEMHPLSQYEKFEQLKKIKTLEEQVGALSQKVSQHDAGRGGKTKKWYHFLGF